MPANDTEKKAFAERLRLAMTRSPKKISTLSELCLHFNLQHKNETVTVQAAQKWLNGRSLPTPDKIHTLATMLQVSEQWLRYGIGETHPSAHSSVRVAEEPRVSYQEKMLEERLQKYFRKLTPFQKKLVVDLAEQLALDREMWRD